MNPVGIDLFTTLPEVAESKTATSAGQETGKGEFLEAFLGMLFAETEADAQPTELLRDEGPGATTAKDEDQEFVDASPLEEEKVPAQSIELEPSPSLGEAESNWAAPVTIQNPEAIKNQQGLEASILESEAGKGTESQNGVVSSVSQPVSGVESNSLPVTETDTAIPLQTGLGNDSAQVLGTKKTVPSPQAQISLERPEPQASAPRDEPNLNVESKPAEFARNASVFEPETGSKAAEPPAETLEARNTKAIENQRPVSVGDRFPAHESVPAAERHVPTQEVRSPRLEVNDLVSAVRRPPQETSFVTVSEGKQDGTRDHSGTENGKQEEQLLRRLEHLRRPAQIEAAERLKPDPNSVERIQERPHKLDPGVTRAARPEVSQFSDMLVAARPETNPLSGGERLILSEPLAARELVTTQTRETFDRIVDQIVRQVSLQQKGETFQLGVRLKPEFLGEIRIETVMDANKTIRAVIHAEDPSVKALLEGKIAGLVQKFDELGIHIDKVEVQTLLTDVGSGNDSSKDRQGLGNSSNGKSPMRSDADLGKQVEEATEEDLDDGHIHLFI